MSDRKKITIRDLQTFIDAVEFASDQEEWVPSAKQWKRIKDMINNLEAEPAIPTAMQLYSPPVHSGFAQPIHEPMPAIPAGPSSMPSFSSPVVAPPIFANPRTPDIDTSTGKYQSGFA